ncbi:AAA family ATPase [Candidatus Halobonum tyrrellensis]|uniref:Replication factor C small subunit n=1 Tax=Candidatus Halobonum tyrrellensis G22 TaxID=1324957 RepID=V4HCX6_9EURY|nr:AAA family ATPase [Candidatus Halobonum tyrrellensis]ESP87908.1 replication factor C small subunit 2 [Candidatus Halobonum tyrrellensis G22]
MDGPLWTETHAPALADLPQSEVRDRLARAVDQPMNLVVQGPAGVGKTAAVRALAREAHAAPDTDLIEINVADFFDRTKKEIRTDPRFEPFLEGRSRMAKRDMINRVLKESAANAPVSGEYKTLVLDNAEAIREDFQQALRRVMERFHRTTQFVIATRQPSKLIPPIRSRCFPVPVRAPTTDETIGVLAGVCEAEGVDYDDDGLEYVASAAGGDLRRAVLAAQTAAVEHGEVTMQGAYETLDDVGTDEQVLSALSAARAGDLSDARGTVDDLLFEEGFDGGDLLRELLRVARSKSDADAEAVARLHALAGEADLDLSAGTDDRLHLTHLLAAWGAGRRTFETPVRDTADA